MSFSVFLLLRRFPYSRAQKEVTKETKSSIRYPGDLSKTYRAFLIIPWIAVCKPSTFHGVAPLCPILIALIPQLLNLFHALILSGCLLGSIQTSMSVTSTCEASLAFLYPRFLSPSKAARHKLYEHLNIFDENSCLVICISSSLLYKLYQYKYNCNKFLTICRFLFVISQFVRYN